MPMPEAELQPQDRVLLLLMPFDMKRDLGMDFWTVAPITDLQLFQSWEIGGVSRGLLPGSRLTRRLLPTI